MSFYVIASIPHDARVIYEGLCTVATSELAVYVKTDTAVTAYMMRPESILLRPSKRHLTIIVANNDYANMITCERNRAGEPWPLGLFTTKYVDGVFKWSSDGVNYVGDMAVKLNGHRCDHLRNLSALSEHLCWDVARLIIERVVNTEAILVNVSR